MKSIKRQLSKIIVVAVALCLVALLTWYRTLFVTFQYALVDGFAIVGVFHLLFGGIVFLSNERAMGALTYSLKQIVRVFKRTMEPSESYHEYISQHQDKKSFSWLMIVGAALLVIGFMIYFL